MDLGFKIQKANLGIRIRILKIPSVPIFREKKENFAQEIQKANVEIRISILEIPYMPTYRQNKQL